MLDKLKESAGIIELFRQRTTLLKAISEVNATVSTQGQDDILERCCKIIIENEKASGNSEILRRIIHIRRNTDRLYCSQAV